MIVHRGRIEEFELAYWYNTAVQLAVHTGQTRVLTLQTLIFTQSWSRKPRKTLTARSTNTCSLADRQEGPGWTFCARFGVWDPVSHQRLGAVSCPLVGVRVRYQAAVLCNDIKDKIWSTKHFCLCWPAWSSKVQQSQDKLVWHHFKLLWSTHWSTQAIFWFLSSLA